VIINCDAVLFDMDGTLIDSTLACEHLLRNWAIRHNLAPDYVIAFGHGRRNLDVVRQLTPHLVVEEEARRLDQEELDYRDGMFAIKGALQLLSALPADRWAVVTSASRSVAQMRFACAGLPAPPVLISSDDVARGKPDPEGYLLAAKRLRFRPERCLVIEDTPAGLEAGRNSGIPVLGITTTFGPDALNCHSIVDFSEITLSVDDDLALRLEIGATRRSA
jgi:mannitol-1-/sugar-/sorbitol-6-phosphatase